jgi:hypothetical protein
VAVGKTRAAQFAALVLHHYVRDEFQLSVCNCQCAQAELGKYVGKYFYVVNFFVKGERDET